MKKTMSKSPRKGKRSSLSDDKAKDVSKDTPSRPLFPNSPSKSTARILEIDISDKGTIPSQDFWSSKIRGRASQQSSGKKKASKKDRESKSKSEPEVSVPPIVYTSDYPIPTLLMQNKGELPKGFGTIEAQPETKTDTLFKISESCAFSSKSEALPR